MIGDTIDEDDQTVTVTLTNANNATLDDDLGAGTIVDDDAAPTVSIAATASLTEGDAGSAEMTLAVTLSAASEKTITVDYATAADTATADVDYTAVSGTLTFAAGDTDETIAVSVLGDTLDEIDETFTVSLSNASNATIDTATATGTILDDDAAPSVSISDASVTEGDTGTTDITFTATLSAPSAKTITVDYATATGTATADADYVTATGTLTFAAGETEKSVTVQVLNDTTDEVDEAFTVVLSNPDNVTLNDDTGTGTIVDNDAAPEIHLDNDGVCTVTEGDSGTVMLDVPVWLSAASEKTISFNYYTADNSAEAGVDYAETIGTLTFEPGDTALTIQIPVYGDTLDENDESLFLFCDTVQNASFSIVYPLDDTEYFRSLGILDDDDPPTISVDDPTVTEGDANTVNLTFTVSLSTASSKNITVGYSTPNGGADYTAVSGTLIFTAGQTTKTVTVTVAGDTIDEDDQTVTLTLASPTNATLSDATGDGTIEDDDAAPTVSIGDASVTEGDSGPVDLTFTVTLSAASEKTITVDYATSADTATADVDYATTTGTLTFSPGDTEETVTVQVAGDTTDEVDEQLTVALSNLVNVTAGDDSATGTITDDDAAPTVNVSDASVTEGDTGTADLTFTVTLSAASGKEVTVDYASSGQVESEPVGNPDYTPVSGTLTFAVGETTKTVTVAVIGDTIDEDDQTVGMTLTNPSNATLDDDLGDGTIVDDDAAPTVSIAATASLAEGDAGSAEMTLAVTLSAASEKTITVDYATAADTATADVDYTAVSGTLTFAAGDTEETIAVAVLGDTLDETDETFTVSLSNDVNATIDTATATGTILDDDAAPTVSIGDKSVTEGNPGPDTIDPRGETGSFTFVVTLSAASAKTITVDYATADVTATAGVDYTAASGTLTFTPGTTTQDITVTILGDLLDETNETFTVTLTNLSNVTDDDTTATGTILDDDATPTVTFLLSEATNGEDGSVTIVAELSAASGLDVTVPFTVTGTATEDDDYAIDASPITIAAGETTASITITINTDSAIEPDETVIVTMGTPVNAGLGDITEHTTTIVDDDFPTVTFTEATSSTIDESWILEIGITVDQTPAKDITIPLLISGTAILDDGEALNPDYSLDASGSLTIAAGSTSATLTLTVISDGLDELDETAIIAMGTLENALPGTITTHTATIIDDDEQPLVSFTTAVQSVEEGGTVTVTAELSIESGRDVTIPVTISGTATADSDYTSGDFTIVIPAFALQGSVTIDTTDDDIDEENETIIVTMGTPDGARIDTEEAGSIDEQTITILDNDLPPTMTVADVTVTEGDSGVTDLTFTISLSAASEREITVYCTSVGATATVGADYLEDVTDLWMRFAPGETEMSVYLQVNGETLYETDETITFTLSNSTNAVITDATATGTITNDDTAPTISISDASVTEGNTDTTAMTFTVTLSDASGVTATVDYATGNAGVESVDFTAVGGTAIVPDDYTAASGSLTFAPGETEKTIEVTIIGETLFEDDETFTVTLSNPTESTLADDSATGTILNDDTAPTVSFDKSAEDAVDEVGSYTLTVTLSAVSGKDVIVPVTISGTATKDGDYTISTESVTIPAGETSASITIDVIEDTTDEFDETAVVTMGTLTNATAGATTEYTLTILDDDVPVVNFTTTSQNVGEGDGTFTVSVELDQPSVVDLEIGFTLDGTASYTQDYYNTASSFTIPAGDTTASVTFYLVNGINDEEDETVIFTLQSANNVELGTDTTQTVTIIDNDNAPAVNFTAIRRTVVEPTGDSSTEINVYVRSSVMSYKDITVPIILTGTAVMNVDYEVFGSRIVSPDGGELTQDAEVVIPGGNRDNAFTLSVLDDTIDEFNETIIASIGTPTNATVGTTIPTETITILDNDAPPVVNITADITNATEGDTVTVTVSLSSASEKPITVPFTVTGTATLDSDYSLTGSSPITFAEGETVTTMTLSVGDDALIEPNETVIITLGTPTNATLGQMPATTVTIADNDDTTDLYVDDDWVGSELYDIVGDGKFFGLNAFATVQDAVNAAGDDYTIHVADGLYYENVDIEDYYGLTLSGAGAETTIIDGMYLNSAIDIYDASDIEITGFTITHGINNLDMYYVDATLANNRITEGLYSGIYAEAGEYWLTHNVISDNVSDELGTTGGGIFIYDALALIADNLITGNTAMFGSAIYVGGDSAFAINNNTITGNTCTPGYAELGSGSAVDITNNGGDFMMDSQVVNNIIWGNEGQDLATNDSVLVAFNNIGTCNGMVVGDDFGNISVDPLFTDGYHLQPGSPCINTGIVDKVVYVSDFDLDLNPRIVGASVDMGCYEAPTLDNAPDVITVTPSVIADTLESATITITGTGFVGSAIVTIVNNDTDAEETLVITSLTDTSITATFNAQEIDGGTWALTVTNYDGQADTLSDALTIVTTRPDLMIKPQADANYVGDDIYNNNAQQTVAATTMGSYTEKAIYDLLIGNDGTDAEDYVVTGPAGSGGWSIRYFNAANADVTTAVTGSGLTVNVPAGDTVALRMEVTAANAVVGNTSNTSTVTVTSVLDGTVTDVVVATSTKTAINTLTLSTTSPTTVAVDNPVTLTASSTGNGIAEYKFRRGVVVGGVTTWDPMPANYTTDPTFIWTPNATGTYSFMLYGKLQGTSTVKWTAVKTFTVKAVSSVTLGATPSSPRLVGASLTLTASSSGGVNPQYMFKASYQDGSGNTQWVTLRGYNASATWTGTLPTDAARTYSLYAYARETGSSVEYHAVSTPHTYITRNPVSAVTVTVSPLVTVRMGTTMTVRGIPTGGANLEYEFRAVYRNASNQLVILVLQPYSASDTWIGVLPTDIPRTYYLYVYAREQGTSVNFTASGTKTVVTVP